MKDDSTMAPRPMSILMSIVSKSDDSKTINNLFFELLHEIFSHPKKVITDNLIHLTLVQAINLHAFLTQKLLKSPKITREMTSLGLLLQTIDKDNKTIITPPRLCRRHKDAPCHEDVYHLGLSLIEDTFQARSLKNAVIPGILQPPKPVNVPAATAVVTQPATVAPTAPAVTDTAVVVAVPEDNRAAITTPDASSKSNAAAKQPGKTAQQKQNPLLDDKEASFIASINAMRGMMEAQRAENKLLKEKIELLTTKVDVYGKELLELKANISTTNTVAMNALPIQQILHNPGHQPQLLQTNTASNEQILNAYAPEFLQPHDMQQQAAVTNIDMNSTGSTSDSSSGFDDEGEGEGGPFTPVSYRRRPQYKPIYGQRTSNGRGIAGPRKPRSLNFFIGGISNDTSEEILAQHIREQVGVLPI